MINFDRITTVILDCDGVIFDSNQAKSMAFREALKENGIGKEDTDAFIEYHITNGGISRYVKFKYLIERILKQDFNEAYYNNLLDSYARLSIETYLDVSFTQGCLDFLNTLKDQGIDIYTASGSDEMELRVVFKKREIAHFFREIYGSPKTKNEIVNSITASLSKDKAIMVGDAVSDLNAAYQAGITCFGMTKYSESKEALIKNAAHYNFACVENLKELIA